MRLIRALLPPTFGENTLDPSTSPPTFGENAADPSTSPPTFGENALDPSASPPTFGENALDPSASPPTFGENALDPSTSPPTFGENVLDPSASPPTFGENVLDPSTSPPTFGENALDLSSEQRELLGAMAYEGDHPIELPLGSYVIVGSFSKYDNAERYGDYLLRKGYVANLGYNTERAYFYVDILHSKNIYEARAQRDRYRQLSIFRQAWVLTIIPKR